MNKNKRNKRDMIDDKAFIKAITRFRNGDQYLKVKNKFFENAYYHLISISINNISNKVAYHMHKECDIIHTWSL